MSLDLNTATSTGVVTVDINEDTATMLSTKLTVDATETSSATAATAAVGFLNHQLEAGDKISFDIDGVGDGTAAGAIVCLEVQKEPI